MLSPDIIRLLLIVCFLYFGYNITYIILFKQRHKNKNVKNDAIKSKEARLFARIGIHFINAFIFLCCLNIFIYQYWILIFPRIYLFNLENIVQIVGFTLVIGGNVTLLLAYRKLGVLWAYPIDGTKKENKLVKSGIYSKIRHPVYLSFNIFCLGFNLILLDWFLLIIYLIGSIGLYFQTIDEEKILIEYFGDEYLEYMKKTGRFFAKFKKYRHIDLI
jgi:protein-S-isoprenylcysteine O-methyltransferase Ste14